MDLPKCAECGLPLELVRQRQLFVELVHELRTPLMMVLGPLQDLMAGCFDDLSAEGAGELRQIHANSARLLDLVNQLQDLSRLAAGGLALRAVHEDLAAFAQVVAQRFAGLARRRDLTLTVDAKKALWRYFDPEQLDKVLTNLLANAVKFTPRGGAVRVVVRRLNGGGGGLEVHDTGSGIAPEELPYLFDRFRQGCRACGGRSLGTGLGLALARDLVELHGGTLEVRSTLGEGSVFTLRLPAGRDHLRDDQVVERTDATEHPTTWDAPWVSVAAIAAVSEQEAAPDAVPEDAIEEDRTTVLVIDDHPGLRAYVRRHLEKRYHVVEAADGRTALVRARELLPDLIVSDVMMGGLDGFELLAELRRDPELDAVPVVLLTARVEAESRLAGLELGADGYLAKPFDVRELVLRVDNLIAARRRLCEHLRRRPAAAPTPLPVAPGHILSADERAFLERLATAIDELLDDEDLTIARLASAVAVSRAGLYRQVESLTGRSPGDLIASRRLDRAAEMLGERVGTVTEVACAVGFRSLSHFAKRFRERYGTSPSAYRRD